jgi:hypothetical protein
MGGIRDLPVKYGIIECHSGIIGIPFGQHLEEASSFTICLRLLTAETVE